jgi:hypothetical protein
MEEVSTVCGRNAELLLMFRPLIPGGLQPPQTTQNRNLKTYFVDIMISKHLRDLPFSLIRPLKSADDSTLNFEE